MHACMHAHAHIRTHIRKHTHTHNTPTTLSCAACVQNVFSKEEGICCCRENSALTKLTGSLINYYKPWSLINLVLINTLEWGIDFWGFNVFFPPSQGKRDRIAFCLLCSDVLWEERRAHMAWVQFVFQLLDPMWQGRDFNFVMDYL